VFVLVTLVALWLGWEVNIIRKRRAALAELREDPAAQVFTQSEFDHPSETAAHRAAVPKVRLLLGDQEVSLIRFDPGHPEFDLVRVKKLFPEADVGRRPLGYPVDSPTQPAVTPVR
jgi:hypothetical protein